MDLAKVPPKLARKILHFLFKHLFSLCVGSHFFYGSEFSTKKKKKTKKKCMLVIAVVDLKKKRK